ncbi:Protein of unknown function [Actinacidiphila yanglinensis]|uniref:DUF998 domain-containing protein n=1 Tax=Actinacidiphila yanglinensis TaxID=310779 RepID=A0A1H5ZV67_9ACTN|nr:DUF998 domain-containing protein [Actinacidiphila yanglinensis]SEG40423.1 Protein of unknown function [Actinacidiphila yanglinensis]
MRLVAWWALISSTCAPVLLVAGFTTATLLEEPGYNPVTQTISVLAAGGRSGYWVFTGTLIAVGASYVATAWGLHAAKPAGRLCLAGGGVAAILLTVFPAPRTGGSLSHGAVVGVGFTLLAVWPLLATRRGRRRAPWGLRFVPSVVVSGLMWVGAAWFLVEVEINGAAGVAERVVTSGQALWPVVVVASCLWHARRLARRRARLSVAGLQP